MDKDDLDKLFRRVVAQSPYSGDDAPVDRVIGDYLTGQLSPEEVNELKRYLESDPELRDSLKDAGEALQWFRDRQKESRQELESMLLQTELAPAMKIDWTALVGRVEEETMHLVGSLIDAIVAAMPSQPAPQSAATFRRASGEQISAEFVDDVDRQDCQFALVEAQVDADGRCAISLSTANRSLWRTDSVSYRCSLTLRVGDVELVFEDAAIDRQGSVDFVVNLPGVTQALKLDPQWIELKIAKLGL